MLVFVFPVIYCAWVFHEPDHFQRELWSSNRLGQQQVIQSDEVSIILSQLTNRLDLLQQHGDRMAQEISQTQVAIYIVYSVIALDLLLNG